MVAFSKVFAAVSSAFMVGTVALKKEKIEPEEIALNGLVGAAAVAIPAIVEEKIFEAN